jgi:hypothetical protein
LLGLVVLVSASAGCQVLLDIDPNVAILDGGISSGEGGSVTALSCADGTPLLCEDFENEGAIDTNRWGMIDQTNGNVAIDSTVAHTGTSSLRAQTNKITLANGGVAAGMIEHFADLPTHFFVRFFANLNASVATATEPEILINLQQTAETGGLGMQLYVQNQALAFTSWANTPNIDLVSSTPFPAGGWHCIEWEVVRNAGQMNVWVDENAVPKLTRSDVVTPAYGDVTFGLSFANPPVQDTYEVWIDDIRVDTARIHCQTK